jgi:thiamine pyrophosphokinase
MPIKGTARASSRGLKYELHQHRLSLQGNTGISNVLIHAQAEVTMKNGVLLCIHEHR